MSGFQKTLYLFIDESGNFDFSPKGSKYFIVTALATYDPVIDRELLLRLRYELLQQGTDQEYFHASEDKQSVRDAVFEILAGIEDHYEVHSVIAQKNKAHPSLYKEIYKKRGKIIQRVTGIPLYQQLCQTLLTYVFTGKGKNIENIVVVLASLTEGEKGKVILRTLKQFLKAEYPGIPFEIFSHRSCADLNCQLADYCCWAISVKWERAELRPYEEIKKRIQNEFPLFRNGKNVHYKYGP
jgi:hypothetical protein